MWFAGTDFGRVQFNVSRDQGALDALDLQRRLRWGRQPENFFMEGVLTMS